MKRPDADDYYWYRETGSSRSEDWIPVKVMGGLVLTIGVVEPVPIEEMEGTFVRMGRPIPFMGNIAPKGLTPPGPDESEFM